jgi:mevalonate kinase
MEALGGAMRENHDLLCALGVSCAELDATVRTLLDAGALGAKLTGAGGGGSAIALARDEAQARAIAQRIPSAFVERLG